MGALATELVRVADRAGAQLMTGAQVASIEPGEGGPVRLILADGRVLSAEIVLANCGPARLADLLGAYAEPPIGCQVKINLLVRRLPRLRSGIDPEVGFAGTLHLGQGYARLQEAYAEAAAGRLPDPLPSEVYCHTLTDDSILSEELRSAGYHTLTLFGLHAPVDLFRADPDGMREQAKRAALRSLQSALAEPLEDCLAVDAHGRPCLEVMTPVDLEAELGMPGGHIFHGDLSWPWLADDADATTPAERWGVATGHDRILLCGAGARRGGAVSGLGGHNAAMAVLERV
jgi:phytoene dehydrogenase-like protein